MIDTSKYLDKINKNNNNNKKEKNKLKSFVNKLLIVIILFLANLILIKSNQKYRDFIEENIYNNNFSFAKIKNFYNKYLGGVETLDRLVNNTTEVFNETLKYNSESIYYDGVKLEVQNNYLVPILEEGMVVFIGEKENYGNTIIIQGLNGIDIWYGNITNVAVKLYDYIEKDTVIGETVDDKLYLVIKKDNEFIKYEDYKN